MKRVMIFSFIALTVIVAPSAEAALSDWGIGQAVDNVTSFSVAVCNKNSSAPAVPTTVKVSVGNSRIIKSTATLQPDQCAFLPFSYQQLGMESGKQYAVNVAIGNNKVTTHVIGTPNATIAVSGTLTNAYYAQLLNALAAQLQKLLKTLER